MNRFQRTIILGLCAIFAGSFSVHADDAAKVKWRLDGVKTPESTLISPDGDVIYVSNVNGAPTEKDGNGFISQISLDGKMLKPEWATGMNAPKGMGVVGDTLYVADIDELVAIDRKTGKITKTFAADGAKFLNDIAIDAAGRVYISDMAGNAIWRLDGETFEKWLESGELKSPNGLIFKGDNLIVGAWGVMTNGFATEVPGNLLTISLADKSIKPLGSGAPVGNLDGLEILSDEAFLATDWMAGKVLKININGDATLLYDLNGGSADLGYDAKSKTIIVPMMNDNRILAFPLPESAQ